MKTIFVSSTFQDMQAERDIIRTKVFPAINCEANCHNDHIEFTDLRWGIDTLGLSEQEANTKILGACLNELHRSDDCMVVILGDRYGWIPDSAYLKSLNISHHESSKMCEMSATALEIEQGVFSAKKKTLVYFREFVDINYADLPDIYYEQKEENKKKLNQLKERLQSSPNCKVHTYPAHFVDGRIAEADLGAFAEQLISDLKATYSREWEEFDSLLDFEKEQEIQWEFIKRKEKEFFARKEERDALVGIVKSWQLESSEGKKGLRKEDHVHFIIGQSGSGKSTLISAVASTLCQDGCDVLPFIGGLTADSSDARRVLGSIVYYIEEQLGLKHLVEFGKESMPKVKIEGIDKTKGQIAIPLAETLCERLQRRLVEIARQYSQNHTPLIVVIDALDQFYPDENRNTWTFCPSGLDGSIRYIITATPDIWTGITSKTVLKELCDQEKNLIIHSSLRRRHKELSQTVMSEILKKKSAEKPLYISMVIDRLMLMVWDDYYAINNKGGTIGDITSHQIDIIKSLPDELSEMATALFDATGRMLGKSFVQKALQYIAISRHGLRESDLSFCLGDDWDSVAFSNLLFFLEDQFHLRSDGRIDFLHKALRKGVLPTIQNISDLHLKMEWCFHKQNTEDFVRASELLYHCLENKDYEYAASVVKPVIYQNFSNDKDVLAKISKRYAKTVADLSLSNRGEWIQEWIQALVNIAKDSENKANESPNNKWNSVWTVLWFLNRFVLDELPQTQAGYETGGSITLYMIEAAGNANNGTWSEEDRKNIIDSIRRKKADYLLAAGREWAARIERKRAFNESRRKYESQEKKEYTNWCKMMKASYFWLAIMKSSSDRNVLEAALEPAAYGIDLLLERDFLDKYINEDECLIGMFYGCIGEVCQNLYAFDANLLAYEQDLRYREEAYKRTPTAENLRAFSGSFHNISIVYRSLGIQGEDNFKNIYSDSGVFFQHTNHPLKLLPVIRFASGSQKTEGEKFMDYCHEQPPIIASLLSKNREIEILEKVIEMKPDLNWNGHFGKYDALWYRYLLYSLFYFEGLKDWNSTDVDQAQYFSPENTEIATERLGKSLEYSWEQFFDEPSKNNALNVMQVYKTFLSFVEFMDNKVNLSMLMDKCIKKSDSFLKLCVEKDCEICSAELNIDSTNTELAKFLLVYSCLCSSELILSIKHTEQEEEAASQWCDLGTSNISSLKLWIDEVSGKITKANFEKIQRYIREQKMRRLYSQLSFGDAQTQISVSDEGLHQGYAVIIEKTIKRMNNDRIPKLAAAVSEKILQNAISSYAAGVKPEEIIAVDDGGLFSQGKKGILYTNDAIYSNDLPFEGGIKYADIDDVFLHADGLCFKMKDDKKQIVDFGNRLEQVYAIIKKVKEVENGENR